MIVGGNYTIDFAKVSNIPKFAVGVKAGDSKREISLTLLENNIPINLNNYTVVVACKKSDGNDILNTVNKVDAINGKCEIEITEQMLALDTDLPCEIVLYGANRLVATSSNFVIGRISSVRDEKNVVSSSEFTALIDALSEVTDLNIYKKKVDTIDKQVNQLASGSPKGVFNTLNDLSINKPSGDNGIYITLDNGHWNYWNGSSWLSGGVYQSRGIDKNSVSFNEIYGSNMINQNLFMYNDGSIIHDKFLMAKTGQETVCSPTQNYSISHYIEVVEGDTYTISCSPQQVCCFYNESKVFIDGIEDLNSNGNEYSFTIPYNKDIKYMRVNINKNLTNLESFSVIGPNQATIDWLAVNELNIVDKSITNKHLKEPILPKKLDGVNFQTKNLIDKNNVKKGYFVLSSDGTEHLNSNYTISNYILVNPGDTITISSAAQEVCCFYDESKTYIQGLQDFNVKDNVNYTFKVPSDSNIMYMRVNLKTSLIDLDDYIVTLGNEISDKYVIDWLYKEPQKPHAVLTLAEVKNLKGKKWLTIGDSITEKNFRATKNYHDYIKEWLGLEVINVAASGTGYIHEFQGVKGWLDRLSTFPNESEIDFITVMGALNDRHHPVGEFGSTDKTELYGALKLFYDGMIEKYPNTPIGVITSTPRDYSWGKTGEFTPHVNAVIDMAQHYSLPLLDLYRCSGLRPWNSTNNKEYFSCSSSPEGDGVHPNDKGQLIMAHKIFDFIVQYLSK